LHLSLYKECIKYYQLLFKYESFKRIIKIETVNVEHQRYSTHAT